MALIPTPETSQQVIAARQRVVLTRLGGSVSCTETRKDDGGCATHGTEEGSIYWTKIGRHIV